MTDKQIIEHELLYEGLEWSVGVDGMFINPKHIPYTNCLYELALAYDSKSKQLIRKEQECEKLNDKLLKTECTVTTQGMENGRLYEQLDQLKAELEQYKNVINKLAGKTVAITSYDKPTEFCDHKDLTIQQLKSENDLLRTCHDNEQAKRRKYEQALEEIREIQNDCDGCNGDCVYCYSGSGWVFKLADEVLKGNFEVLDE